MFALIKLTLVPSQPNWSSLWFGLLLDDDRKHAEQNVVGPSFALADVYCPFQDGAERSNTNHQTQSDIPRHDALTYVCFFIFR